MKKVFKFLTALLMTTAIISGVAANATTTYDPNNLRILSGASTQEIYDMLYGTTYQTWETARAFKDAEDKYNVNAVFLIALTRVESNHGRSPLATKKNNITSWRLNTNSWRAFKTKEECIECTARLIDKSYLTPGGVYNRGVSIYSVNKCYCEGNYWSNLINQVANEIKC